jgi:regulator-associated protein of mTOR
MWDWSSSRKTGTVKLDLGLGSVITSARFVNELFERVVVLAEISKPYL